MITQDEVIPLLLAACPGFEPAWREHLEWWGDRERGIYNDTAAFATYIIDSYGSGHTAEFDLAFAALERILAQGDENARAAASIGALNQFRFSPRTILLVRPRFYRGSVRRAGKRGTPSRHSGKRVEGRSWAW
jgi:hypothetical protein